MSLNLNEKFSLEYDEKSDEVSGNKTEVAKKIIRNIQKNLDSLLSLMESGGNQSEMIPVLKKTAKDLDEELEGYGQQVIEGVFDGEKMISQNGEIYEVPSNYASKSKLIEGDILKLTISADGKYVFKQISPIERKRVVGQLCIDETTGNYYVMTQQKAYQVNPAAVSYYKGMVENEVILLVAKDGSGEFGAIENIIK